MRGDEFSWPQELTILTAICERKQQMDCHALMWEAKLSPWGQGHGEMDKYSVWTSARPSWIRLSSHTYHIFELSKTLLFILLFFVLATRFNDDLVVYSLSLQELKSPKVRIRAIRPSSDLIYTVTRFRFCVSYQNLIIPTKQLTDVYELAEDHHTCVPNEISSRERVLAKWWTALQRTLW